MNLFRSTDILLPQNCDLEKWAVIACDQYTSQPEYWNNVKSYVKNAPSTLHLFFPESDLSKVTRDTLQTYCHNMQQYCHDGTLKEYKNSYVYVERTLANGDIRQGVLGIIDLEFYDYDPKPDTKIFATEATVLQRVPPRVALRKNACLEFSHTVMFLDDTTRTIIETVGTRKDSLELLYNFDLMFGGGNVCGYLLNGDAAVDFEESIRRYEDNHVYLVGDGNHSLVTAKLTYQALKETNPNVDWQHHPARYAMVELENIHSPSMIFEPIYRVITVDSPNAFLSEFTAADVEDGVSITWVNGNSEGVVRLKKSNDELPIEALQRFLDHWVENNGGTVDYIHGKNAVRELALQRHTIGFLLPDLEKSILFPYILSGKVMPKKTFSIGHASEKRYYLEGRKII